MSKLGLRRAWVLVVALCGLLACSEDGGPEADGGLPDEVSAEVGEQGGKLKANGVTLEIPEGALAKTVTISIKKQSQAAPVETKTKQLSDLYEFGPAGTKFKKDVSVTFDTEKHEPKAAVYFTKEASSEFEKLPSETKESTVSAKVRHFSQGFAGIPLDEIGHGNDAGGGEVDAGGGAADAGGGDGVDASSDGGAAKRRIVVRSRDVFGVHVNQTWAAFQDGDGPWQFLSASGEAGHYEFEIASSRYGVVFVCSDAQLVNSWGTLRYEVTETAELEVTAVGAPCTAGTEEPTYSVMGTLNKASADVYWRVGHAHLTSGIIYTGGPASINIGGFKGSEPNDLLFGVGPNADVFSRILIERGLTLTDDVSDYSRDTEKDGFAVLGSATAEVHEASENTSVEVRYVTRGTRDGLMLSAGTADGTTTRTVSFSTLPENQRLVTDRYLLRASESDQTSFREAIYSTYATGDLSVSLPAPFEVTFTSVGTPYTRPSYGFTARQEAASYAFSLHYSPTRNSAHDFSIEVEPAWLESTSAQSLTFPDLSQVPGFQAAWVPPSSLGQTSVELKAAVRALKGEGGGTLTTEAGALGALQAP